MPDDTRQPVEILSELLVLQVQGGDPNALTQLVDLWSPRLRARALRISRDHDASLEIVQETWIGIARGIHSLKDPSRFGAWSLRIVQHKAADWIKARSLERARVRALLYEPNRSASPPDECDRDDHAATIRDAIGNLDPKLREVVYLFFMDNCTLEQVAIVLNIPLGTAKTRLARARARLKPILEKQLERSTQ